MSALAGAAPRRFEARVLRNPDEGGGNRRLVLAGPGDAPEPAPGQFLMLHLGAGPRYDPLLPRPMAVFRSALAGGVRELEVLYKVVGRGTALLAGLRPGDRLAAVGPLGRGFPDPAPGERSVLVGGGTGVASLYELAARCRERGPTLVLLGARRAAELMGRADFESLDVPLRLATDDGSAGARGLVTALLEETLAADVAARVYACGPTAMMQRAAALAAAAGARCWLALENRMACGFGVCLGCAVPQREEGFFLVCRDGPVLPAESLALAGLP